MIYLGILNISELDRKIEHICAHKLGDEVKNRINEAKNPESRRARFGAYSLVLKMYAELKNRLGFPEEAPEICYTGTGKPYFKANDSLQNLPKLSISHDSELCVCAFSLSSEVGADIQSMPKRRLNLSRIADKFFAPMRNVDSSLRAESREAELEILFYKCSGTDILPTDKLSVKRIKDARLSPDFLSKWTLLEAVLKMGGEGFGDASRADKLIETAETATLLLDLDGTEYYISVAAEMN